MEVGLALTTKTERADRHALDHRVRYVWKLAKRLQTWQAVGRATRTVAGPPALRKASRRLAKAV